MDWNQPPVVLMTKYVSFVKQDLAKALVNLKQILKNHQKTEYKVRWKTI